MRSRREIKYDAMEEVKTVKMEELYITPFTARREYDKEGLIQGFPLYALAPPLIGAESAGRGFPLSTPPPGPSPHRGGECWTGKKENLPRFPFKFPR